MTSLANAHTTASAPAITQPAGFNLTPDQEAAYWEFFNFLSDNNRHVLTLEGYAGTGKTTLIRTILQDYDERIRTYQLLDPKFTDRWEIYLTATTHKAAEAFSLAVGREVNTLQSALGMVVKTDYSTGETSLTRKKGEIDLTDALIFVDEANFIDGPFMQVIFRCTRYCKIVFMGDPAQLTPVKSSTCPVFAAGFDTVRLTEVVRQKSDNPIMELVRGFREGVTTGEMPAAVADGHHIQHLDRADFEAELANEFNRPDWSFSDSKILAWTNKTAIAYNQSIRNMIQGQPLLQSGDYAINNTFVGNSKWKIKTDATVFITRMEANTRLGVRGWDVLLDGSKMAFLPESWQAARKCQKEVIKEGQTSFAEQIDKTWVDLRAAYACTINKSQGSTFRKVFIDLDDLSRCRNYNTLLRLLYVGTSRASEQVIFTGELA